MKPGDKMTWLYEQRGGYGFIIPVNAEVVKVNSKTVRVRVQKHNGQMVERNVKPESLRPRITQTPQYREMDRQQMLIEDAGRYTEDP